MNHVITHRLGWVKVLSEIVIDRYTDWTNTADQQRNIKQYSNVTINHIVSSYYHYTIIILSLYYHYTIIILSLYYHYTIIILSLYYHYTIIILSLYYHYTIIILSLYYHYTIIILSLYYHYTIIILSLYYHDTIIILSLYSVVHNKIVLPVLYNVAQTDLTTKDCRPAKTDL